jgi:serine/threonine protein kinase
MKWWDHDTIESTVTRQFVCSQLLPDEVQRLDRSVGFGDGLTDGTYWEWIDEKAKRIFLILVDLGVPDQIFGVIDDSWDDEDLPIALDQVERLSLTASKDEKLEKRFYYRQFYYLLRRLEKGDHTIYDDDEVVPLDVVDRKVGVTSSNHVDRVSLPNQAGRVFCRRRIPLGSSGPGSLSEDDLVHEINSIRHVQNDHLVSYWASYVYQGSGYVLFTPAGDFNLKALVSTTPAAIKNMDKLARRRMVMNWIHCLVDTLGYMHSRGLSHGNIKPSTVHFTSDNHIFFSDFTRLTAELHLGSGDSKTSFDKESYDYAAPEQWFRPSYSASSPPLLRRSTMTSVSGSPPDNSSSPFNFSITRHHSVSGDHASSVVATSPVTVMHSPTPNLNPQAADIFSLGCVILELISFVMKKPTRAFASHRAARHKTPGRGGAVLDSSFHKNLGQVETWMSQLAREAAKKAGKKDADARPLAGIAPILRVVERMLAPSPADRPSAHEVQNRMYSVLRDSCGIPEPHCVHRYRYTGFDFGIGALSLQPAPASPTLVAGTDTASLGHSSGGERSPAGRPDSWGSWGSATARSDATPRAHVLDPAPYAGDFVDNTRYRPAPDLRIRADPSRQWQQTPPVSPVYVGY